MKKHPFMQAEFLSNVPLTRTEKSQILDIFKASSKVLQKLLKKKKIIKSREKFAIIKVFVLLCGDKEMKKLNHDSRGKNKVTDVLSFPYHENLRKNQGSVITEKSLYLGEMAICIPQTRRQAKEFKIRFRDEFTHLFVHGIFHLFGFDHEVSLKEELLMQKMEDEMLEEISRLNKKAKKMGS